jgi:hypothetical protein
MLQVRERSTGEIYEVAIQCVDVNFTGYYRMRYNIGHDTHFEWVHCFCLYDNADFNEQFEVINDNYKSVRAV